MAQEPYEIADAVDITDLVCPMTFVTAKAALAELEIGKVLRVHLAAGEPMQNVPRSFADDGQKVLRTVDGTKALDEVFAAICGILG